jgi:LacI family transcriptional regulator
MRGLVLSALDTDPDVAAVYSIGGGTSPSSDAFAARRRACAVFVAQDLDRDNSQLLREARISAVLHRPQPGHAPVCQTIMQAHGALPGTIHSWPSTNLPAVVVPER